MCVYLDDLLLDRIQIGRFGVELCILMVTFVEARVVCEACVVILLDRFVEARVEM